MTFNLLPAAPAGFEIKSIGTPKSYKSRTRAEDKLLALRAVAFSGCVEAWVTERQGRWVPVVRITAEDFRYAFPLAHQGIYVWDGVS